MSYMQNALFSGSNVWGPLAARILAHFKTITGNFPFGTNEKFMS